EINGAISSVTIIYGDSSYSYETTPEMRKVLSAIYVNEFQGAFQGASEWYIAAQLGDTTPKDLTVKESSGTSDKQTQGGTLEIGGNKDGPSGKVSFTTTSEQGTNTGSERSVKSDFRNDSAAANLQTSLNLGGQFISQFASGSFRGPGALMTVTGPNGYKAKERLSERTAINMLKAVRDRARASGASTFTSEVQSRR